MELRGTWFGQMLLPTLKRLWEEKMEDEYDMVFKRDFDRFKRYFKARLDNHVAWLKYLGTEQTKLVNRVQKLENRVERMVDKLKELEELFSFEAEEDIIGNQIEEEEK